MKSKNIFKKHKNIKDISNLCRQFITYNQYRNIIKEYNTIKLLS